MHCSATSVCLYGRCIVYSAAFSYSLRIVEGNTHFNQPGLPTALIGARYSMAENLMELPAYSLIVVMNSRRNFIQTISFAAATAPFTSVMNKPAMPEIVNPQQKKDTVPPETNTSDIIIDKLISWEVSLVFSLVGDGINPIYEALRKKQDKIKVITVRHEEAAAFMASAYAKATGKLGVCLATTGPGAVHLMNGLYDAAMEGAPVLAITGVVNHDLLGTQFTQEVDTIAMLQNIAVFNQLITGPLHAQTIVDLACRAALTTPGLAHITVSTDTQMKPLSEDKRSQKGGQLTGSASFLPRKDIPADDEINAAAAILNKSNKIMILSGRGALLARKEVEALAEKLGAPVAKALLGKALLPDDSPYTTGGTGRLGTLPSREMMKSCDVLLILGSTMPHLEYYPEPGNARGIQVDGDPKRIGLRYPVEVGLHGDVKATLQVLLPKIDYHANRDFLQAAQQKMNAWKTTLNKLETDQSMPIKPPFLVAAVSRLLKDNALIAIDTGAHTVFTARHLRIKGSQQVLACGNLASMAPGLPYVIAAQLAYPGRQCVAMVGDGGFTMLMGEMATAVLYNLPIKVVIFKNNPLAMDKFEQEEIGSKDYGVSLQPIDFVKIAEACGAEGFKCSKPADLDTVLKKAFASPGPAVIEVDVDPEARPDPPEKLKV
jgi:pyruvate dehydrogenase (quinone)